MKLTDWYPAHIKPVRVGWYHTMEGDRTNKESPFNWYWDGHHWLVYPNSFASLSQSRKWRGIAK